MVPEAALQQGRGQNGNAVSPIIAAMPLHQGRTGEKTGCTIVILEQGEKQSKSFLAAQSPPLETVTGGTFADEGCKLWH